MKRPISDSRGSAVLETMAVLPVLLFVMLGVAEFSRAWLALNLVTTAAREGARTGSVTPTSAGNVFNSAPALARIDQLITDSTKVRSVTCATPCVPDSQVQATVSITFTTVVPLILPMLSSVTLTQTATMRYE